MQGDDKDFVNIDIILIMFHRKANQSPNTNIALFVGLFNFTPNDAHFIYCYYNLYICFIFSPALLEL